MVDTGQAAERVRRGGRGSAARVVCLVRPGWAETGIKKAGGPSGPRLGSGPGWRSCRQRLARVGHRSPAIRRAVGRQRASDEMSLRHSEEPSWTGRGWAICRTGRESRPLRALVSTACTRSVDGRSSRRMILGRRGRPANLHVRAKPPRPLSRSSSPIVIGTWSATTCPGRYRPGATVNATREDKQTWWIRPHVRCSFPRLRDQWLPRAAFRTNQASRRAASRGPTSPRRPLRGDLSAAASPRRPLDV